MKVKEIVIYVAKILGLNDVEESLLNDSDSSNEINDEIQKIVLGINMLNGMIASQYIELKDIKAIENSSSLIPYKLISNNQIIEIKRVTDINNVILDFVRYANGIKCNADNIKIEFTYFPSKVTIDDSIDYYLGLDELTFAQGVVGQYLFLKGDFEESYVWDEKFKYSLSSLVKVKRNIEIPCKRWY